MANNLVSPGVQITVTDESQYAPTAASTVPLLFIATAQDKQAPSGDIAAGTTKANANSLYVLTSQRDVLNYFGTPHFHNNAENEPIHGYEANEYGLLTAYSLLGVTSRCYVIRADIDLAELYSLGDRPLADPLDQAYWLDLTPTRWGIFKWDATEQQFITVIPTVITNTDDLSGGAPKESIGHIGDYAVVATNSANPVYYKNRNNNWVLVGSTITSSDGETVNWRTSVPALISSVVSPELNPGDSININDQIVVVTTNSITDLSTQINGAAIPGITTVVVGGKLYFYIDDTAKSDGSTVDSAMQISNDGGDPLGDLGITLGKYYSPTVQISPHTSVPQWKKKDTAPRPTGSIWVKTTAQNYGSSFAVKRYNKLTENWLLLRAPVFADDGAAIKDFDPLRGGSGIPAGSVYVQTDISLNKTVTYKLFYRAKTGVTIVTGKDTSPGVTSGDKFTISYTVPTFSTFTSPVEITLTGNTPASFVEDVLAAGIDYIGAQLNPDGTISIYHTNGGSFVLNETEGTPIADIGIFEDNDFCRSVDGVYTDGSPLNKPNNTLSDPVPLNYSNAIMVSNWVAVVYTASRTAPGEVPPNKKKWYWGELGDADIMIHDGLVWRGYRNVSLDARGFNLTITDPNGPMFSPIAPTTQSDKTTLEYGDLWIDTSDLENYPMLYRWERVSEEDKWVQIDLTDQTSENGILFKDARFMGDTTSDVVVDTMTPIKNLLLSDQIDIDAPDSLQYPRGMLLFNTRRSSFNVKEFRRNYFNSIDFPGEILPTETNAWVSISGSRENGHAFFGRKAQRNVVQKAIASAIDTNKEIREEMREFNLIAAPGYPELIQNMIQLNNDRKQTAFVIGDSPFRMPTEGTELTRWLQNSELEEVDSENCLVTRDPYLGVFYPSVLGTDLAGNQVAMPASFSILRMILLSDQASFPWFAPAGVRRGQLDNAKALGYLTTTGEFYKVGVRQGIRDILYENNVNPMTYTPVTGIINDGNKTRSSSSSALDRINVARLICYMRTQLDKMVRPFLFEPNDKITRDEVKGVVESFCNDLISKRALYDYFVQCDEVNNTPDRIDRNELYIDIAIEPVKAVEFIYIPIRIKNTGEIASGNLASARRV